MLARLVFSLVLGLLMYVPRSSPKPPVDTVPPTPDELPPGDGGRVPPVDIPEIDLPGVPIPMPDIDIPNLPRRPGGGHLPSLPPTPPPGYEGDWPPASERPDVPPTPPPGHDGPWAPGNARSFRERVREIIQDLRLLLDEGEHARGVDDADEGARKLGGIAATDGPETLEA